MLVRLGRRRKPAPREEHVVVPPGVEALGARRIVETFLGPLEVLNDKRLDGLIEVRRANKDVLLVSRNIVEPSPRPVLNEKESKDETVSEMKTTEGKEEILV